MAAASMTFLIRDSWRHTRAKEAMLTWQPINGKLARLESFVRKSSFYYRVEISYRQNDVERVFSESWIPSEWWDEGVGAASVGTQIALLVDPSDPERAIWNPQFQVTHLEARVARNKSMLIASCLSCGAFLLGARIVTGWGRQDTVD